MAGDSHVTIGLLAGMGVRSTSPFVDLLELFSKVVDWRNEKGGVSFRVVS